MTIAIDWDDCIQDRANPPKGKRFGAPLPGAEEAIEDLIQEGIKVIIHTCMAVNKSGKKAVEEWMDYFDIPYTEVTAVKPDADLYIDNKGLHHVNWKTTIKEINSRLGLDIDGVD